MTGVYRRNDRGAFERQADVVDEMPEPQPANPDTSRALQRITWLEQRVRSLESRVDELERERS
jgi:hypothetical protein